MPVEILATPAPAPPVADPIDWPEILTVPVDWFAIAAAEPPKQFPVTFIVPGAPAAFRIAYPPSLILQWETCRQ